MKIETKEPQARSFLLHMNAGEARALRSLLHVGIHAVALARQRGVKVAPNVSVADELHREMCVAEFGINPDVVSFERALAALMEPVSDKAIPDVKPALIDVKPALIEAPPVWIIEGKFAVSGWGRSGNDGMSGEFATKLDAEHALLSNGRGSMEYRVREVTSKKRAPFFGEAHKGAELHVVAGSLGSGISAQLGWIIQYNQGQNYWDALTKRDLNRQKVYAPSEAPAVFGSRNEAYRQMRARAKHMGYNVSMYRVVPAGTPSGAEVDRGYYRVEFGRGEHWRTAVHGPGNMRHEEPYPKFSTADQAQHAIDSYGIGSTKYRVKWYPNNPENES